MKLATGITIVTTIGFIVLFGILAGVFISGWKNSARELWDVAASQTRDNIMEVINTTLNFVEFAARSVPQIDTQLGNMQIKDSGYDPTSLLRAFAAFNELSNYHFGSMGFMMHTNGSNSAKASWQIANGFGCPTYMYAYSDNSINPAFYGYCGVSNGTVDFSKRTYTGADWGLKRLEIDLLAGKVSSTFLPIFDLLGAFTLTFEAGYTPKPTGVYAISFAELDLNALSNHIEKEIDLLNGKGLAYIFESQTGVLVASTIANSLFATNGTRYSIFNSPSQIIRDTADGQDDTYLVLQTQRSEVGLNWTVVVAVRDSDIYGRLNTSVLAAALAGFGVLIFFVTIFILGVYCWVTKPLKAKKDNLPAPYTMFDEVK